MSGDETPGWDAIAAAGRRVHAGQEPLHYGTVVKWMLGGPDPLDGIDAYRAPGHWHFVGYGLSELYGKESEDKETSGFGFELTFRVERGPSEDQPPFWAMNLLQNLARYVATSGNRFDVGHHVNANGPIKAGEKTALTVIAFALDPQLGEIGTPNGHVKFLQVVGVTLDELEAMKSWRTEGVLALIAEKTNDPLHVTRLGRESVVKDPAVARKVAEGAARDGSSLGETFASHLIWKKTGDAYELEVGAIVVPAILSMLAGRIAHAKPFVLMGEDAAVIFEAAAEASAREQEGALVVGVSPALAKDIAATLFPKRGTYALPALASFTLRVQPTEIKGQDGAVEEVIG